jgi:hypothetical protein
VQVLANAFADLAGLQATGCSPRARRVAHGRLFTNAPVPAWARRTELPVSVTCA